MRACNRASLGVLLSGALWLTPFPASASPPQASVPGLPPVWTPTLGAELGYTPERLRVSFPTETYEEDRSLWNSRLTLGLDGRWPSALGTLDLRSLSEVGYGFVHHTGHGLLELSQTGLLEHEMGHAFALSFGGALVGALDTSSAARSSLTLGLPIGLRFRGVEIWYRVGFVVPLGSEREPVFIGTRELSARPGINWLDFGLRVHLGFLEF
ncbi:MAG: hypothetical protein AB7S68_34960 [Polyangiaceae bacterium]